MTKKQDQDESVEKIEDENIETTEQESPEDDLETQLAAAQQSAKDNWDKVLRAQAEMENLKRRNAKDLENAHKFALDGFVKALLEVKDSLTMGLKTAKDDNASVDSITEGLEMTDKVFLSTMEKFGVELLDPTGEAFNPEFHEAVTMIPMPDKESNSVLEVVQHGFTLNGRLVRPAMVVVVQ
ncbi:nucleotide exchange factor GrpE [Candidatus Thioglobus sp.]|jgi:molecular chaperone GrpE|uniref:nucleotide exchange factor GrpE n=1 Tax=Candidatus Thioglobus sp. TaxID=2026721 RepID=UPI001D28D6EE|nr:nucleotide exchange factor GrpE [Candidatus Thioglobus sp.]MBT3276850.1 nucleotide exchange factor GrpE [Candidatus Thioglobus sp.]MBT4747149.1 nucleotide exchange factor GrpE [Candidatus Thioglobus sp.]MBT5165589.1 nucleotide exchange factor GrpE [Candidatus Thioglobus sp.]MBT6278871.1 nucleotide exchange factor GrpE [Candidatus Thioglobus sp.]MBT6753092.1 nucleotide exchange factor GrpE [Candidatus Thioglobus sp.]